MSAERLQRLEAVFHAARDLPPGERTAYLDRTCGDDEELRREVKSLLGDWSDAGLASGGALRAVAADEHTVHTGRALGPYRLGPVIGVGGMGAVYRARDTKLQRDVAVKILPRAFADDPERLARFDREARALAALNHPHIAQIYGVEEAVLPDGGGTLRGLILELVDGETLAERLRRGRPPLSETLRIAIEIASALEAAHDRGIIHRDLKPANIKLTSSGAIKVLDFGLAKSNAVSEGNTALATSEGTVLGTPAYMSPEQVRGEGVDKRTDIWAFGCVLFELLTGQRAFAGSTASDAMAAVLTREPDWAAVPPDAPGNVRMLLGRCLQKDRARRLRDLGDARFAIEDATSMAADIGSRPSGVPSGGRLWMVATASAALAAAVTWGVGHRADGVPAAVMPTARFEIETRGSPSLNVTTSTPTLAMSHDGARLVYVAGTSASGGPLAIRELGDLTVRLVAGALTIRDPFFSPDGQWIGFFSVNGLHKIPVTGGTPITLVRDSGVVRGASWADDGAIIFATPDRSTGLLRVNDGGGSPVVLTTPDTQRGEIDHVMPWTLPGGRAVLFTVIGVDGTSRVDVLDLGSKARRILVEGAESAQYSKAGYLVYPAAGALFAVRFDPSRLEVTGDPVTLVNDVLMGVSASAYYAVSDTGHVVYVPADAGDDPPRTLVWVDRAGVETPVGVPTKAYQQVSLSPDERRIAVAISDRERDVWTWDRDRGTLVRVTEGPQRDTCPVWMPDGRTLLFASRRSGTQNIYRRAADGSGVVTRLTTSDESQVPVEIAADGTTLIGNSTISGDGSCSRSGWAR